MNRTNRRRFLQGSAAGAAAIALPMRFASAAKRGGVMRMGKAHGQTSDALDPAIHDNGFVIAMTHAYNGYLTEVMGDGSLAGQLAESWEPSADGKVWTFRLRRGLTYHNGRDVVAEDVIASIDHHRGEDSKSAAAPIVKPIVNIESDGKYTVKFTLDAGNADFPFVLSDYHLPVMPVKDGKADWQSGIGCGVYRLSNFEPGIRADFTRYEDHFDSDRGHFDEINMLAIVDPTARTNALMTGQVDAIDRVDLKTVDLLKSRAGIKVHSIAGTQHYTFPMRTDVPPFDNVHVRLALKHAIKRDELVEKILQGYGAVGNDHPIGQGQLFFARDLEQRQYDPDAAKDHLKDAQIKGRLEVDLNVADAAFAGAVDAAVLFAESAKDAGIDINVVREPNDGYWSNVWNKKPFCACYWGGRPTVDLMFQTAYQAGVPWNDAVWENDRFNSLLLEARAEFDAAKREEMYFEMQQLVRDDGGTIVPMFASYVFATSDKLQLPEDIASNWDLDGERWTERWSFV